MKKLLSLLLVFVMVLGLMAGCATNDPKETTGDTTPSTEGTKIDYANSTVILYTGNVRGDVSVYEKIAAAKAAYEAKGSTVYLVDAGNYLQGTAYANSDRGLSIYNLMDAAGYDVAAMGAYEFVYGDATTGYAYHSNVTKYFTQAELYKGAEALEYQKNAPWADEAVMANRDAKAAAAFKVVCSNLTAGDQATGYYAFENNVVLGEALKVGFVSTIDESVADFIQDGYLSGYTFGTVTTPACDVVVALGSGEGDIKIAAPVDGKLVVGAYVIDNTTKKITEETVDMTGTNAEVAALVSALTPATVVGKSEITLDGSDSTNWNGESNLGDLTTDALLWYAQNKLTIKEGATLVAIQNGGNCDNYIYTGEITEVDLLKALPFSPMGVGVVYITGAQLLDTLEASTQMENCPGWAQVAGIEYTIDTSAAYDAGEAFGDFFKANSIKRVTITSVGGQTFDENATYAVIADNFLLGGNDTYYTFGAIDKESDSYMKDTSGLKTRDIVALYIQEVLGGTIGSDYTQAQNRITVK